MYHKIKHGKTIYLLALAGFLKKNPNKLHIYTKGNEKKDIIIKKIIPHL